MAYIALKKNWKEISKMIYLWTKLLKPKKNLWLYNFLCQTLKALEYIETNNKVFVCDALDDFYNVTHTGG